MTRFDEALQHFAEQAEPGMRDRVGSVGNRYVTEQEIGRGRTRRAALQATAALAAVAVVGGAAWFAAGHVHTVDPAQHVVDSIPALDDPAFVCGVPFPYEQGVTTIGPKTTLPDVKQSVTLKEGNTYEVIDLTPGATTLPTETSVSVSATGRWYGESPQFWGMNTFGVLVDADGNVAARSALIEPTETQHDSAGGLFLMNSCSDPDPTGAVNEPLDGTFTVHVVTQYWLDNPGNIVAMWVDEGLPANAAITFDYELYKAQQEAADLAAEATAKKADALIIADGNSLASVGGAAILPATSACAIAATIDSDGLAAMPAMAADYPAVKATMDGREVVWTYKVSGNEPWWADGGDFAMFYFDKHGRLVSAGAATITTHTSRGDEVTERAVVEPDQSCGLRGVPTASGSYRAFVFAPYPGTFGMTIPSGMDLETLSYVSGWAPVGTYTVP